ncbi:TPA: hypothetical protein ACRNON_000129 [Pseudomonas aeruginosa]
MDNNQPLDEIDLKSHERLARELLGKLIEMGGPMATGEEVAP